jgi:hypothetical protein
MKESKQKHTAPAARTTKRAVWRMTTPTPIVVTDENVQELKKRFDALSKDDPDYDRRARQPAV